MEVSNEQEIERQFEIFEKTFSSEEDRQQATEIVSFIARSCNDRSLRGFIGFEEFKNLVLKNSCSLFTICYIDFFDFLEEKIEKHIDELSIEELEEHLKYLDKNSDDTEIIEAKEKFRSSSTLLYLLLTRVQEGRDYKLIMTELESRKPTLVATQK